MADIRIKDLATTATTTASDDFMAVDGSTNGTRKLSAAAPAFLTSVTTPSLTSPASTNLTLGTTNSGAAITVLSASNNVGIGTITPAQLLHVYSTGTVQPVIEGGLAGGWPILEIKHGAGSRWLIENGRTAGMLGFFNATNGGQRAGFTDAGNLLIGTTDETGLTGAGGLKINSSTAGSSGAGALVLQGGISAGGASYFGGAVTIGNTVNAVSPTSPNRTITMVVNGVTLYIAAKLTND